jgi:predicted TIM-barrel enzyme
VEIERFAMIILIGVLSMKAGDLVRYKDSLRDDVGIIIEMRPSASSTIFGRKVIVMTTTGLRQYSEKNLEILNEGR